MKRRSGIAVVGFTAAVLSGSGVPALAEKVSVDLPQEQVRFRAGPGQDVATARCTICHAAGYVYMQPPLTREQWSGVVAKMRKVFGAPIDDAQAKVIVDYLVTQNGKK
jgi:cytochrome c5